MPDADLDRADDAARAQFIIEDKDIFALAAETMTRRGYAGDPTHVELLYAIFTSRLLPRPMCAFLKAPSSSGKSWLLNRTLELFPPEAYEIKSGFTPKAIAYGQSDLRHRILAIQEASGMQGREGNMLVRTLISEGLVRWEVAGRAREGFTTRDVMRPGPIAFVMMTSHDLLHKDDETRALSIQVDDTPTHTRRVLESIAGRYSGVAPGDSVDLAPWHAYQRWLAGGPRDVVVPFAATLAHCYWAQSNRSKRDFEQVLTAIAASALMHQVSRTLDASGRLVAAWDDYAMARRFLLGVIGEASGATVPASVRETVRAIAQLATSAMTPERPETQELHWPDLSELAAKLGVDKSTASRRVAKAKELGYVVDLRVGPVPLPSRLAITQRLPTDYDLLPTVERLREMDAAAHDPQPAAADNENRTAEPNAATPAPMDTGAPASTDAAPPPAPAPPPASAPAPAIVANAPWPDQPDGGYRGRRAITAYRTTVAERGAAET